MVNTPEAAVGTEPPLTAPLPGMDPPMTRAGQPADVPAEPPGLVDTLAALREEMMLAFNERLHLVALECKQVSLNATQMVLLATVAGLMLAGAWATVLIGVYMACTAYGLHWGLALLLVIVLNVAGAGLAWIRAHSLSAAFTFPATLRMIKRLTTSQPKA
jgi:hypothetical protein